jgi:hypothetical protein
MTFVPERFDGRNTSATIAFFPGAHLERERNGEGWLVLTERGHGWLFGDHPAALHEIAWHRRQRGQR